MSHLPPPSSTPNLTGGRADPPPPFSVKARKEEHSGKKIDKGSTLYVHYEDTDYQCRDCTMFIPGKKRCTIHGAGDVIQGHGSCGFFIPGKPMKGAEPHGPLTHERSGYTESVDGFSCKRCAHFLPDEYDCKTVDKDSPGDDEGEIHPDACCNDWEAKGNRLAKTLGRN